MPFSDVAAAPLYYLVAPAGFPNYGDELIVAGWLRHLADVAPDATVWVDTHSPGPAQVLFRELFGHVRFTDTLWRLCSESSSENPWEVAAWVQEVVHNPGTAARWHHGISLLQQVDVVHVVGGGYINKIWPKHVGLLAGAAAAVRRSGGRAAMTGQGLIPAAEDSTPLLRALADRFEIVDVRDAATAELLDVAPGVDDAFLSMGTDQFITPDEAWPGEEPPEVMLCLQSDMNEVGKGRLAGAALSILREWQVPPHKLCVVEGIPRIDRDIFALFEQEMPGARFYPFADVWDKGLPVSSSQTWISTRFHLHMAAAAAGASGVAISISPDYYATKHRSLIDLGSGWTLLENLDEIPARPTDGGFPADTLANFRQSKLELAKAIYAPVVRPEPEPDSQSDAAPDAAAAPPPPQRRRWARRPRNGSPT